MPRKRTASVFSQLNTHRGGLHKSSYSKCITLLLDLSCAAVQAFNLHLAFSRPETATDHHALATARGHINSINGIHNNKNIYVCVCLCVCKNLYIYILV